MKTPRNPSPPRRPETGPRPGNSHRFGTGHRSGPPPSLLGFLAGYGLRFVLGGQKARQRPIAAGLPLTDICNLSCLHCVVKGAGRGHHPIGIIESWMRELYAAGARILYLQGGEILLWQDGDLRANDVIALARRIGFLRIAVVTNGSLPIDLAADAVWVSVDGPPEIHDRIRGQGAFDLLRHNVAASSHPKLYANLTINNVNADFIEETLKSVAGIPGFRGISVNFHTPYPGVESLAVPRRKRESIVRLLLALRRKGYKILNSTAGLRLLASGRYSRPVASIRLVEQGKIFACCWGRGEPGVCDGCGYGIIAELAAIASFRPSAMIRALTLF